ncbi:MAG: aminotransferase class I/II-fold pyridoxal phosphate-dependent enzyme [Actinobacteria bacterium]|jgi:cystathionine gamma-synthase|nr:aminotransferase class I/II-fold pyridoxal phosphate-dependent enzyme [Actinomycetota bacterium]
MSTDREYIKKLSPESQVVASGRPGRTKDASLNPNIELSATFHAGGDIGYGRFGNASWKALEEAIELIEGGKTILFSSGLAAISAIFKTVPNGSVIVTSKNGYTGTMNLLRQISEINGMQVRYVDVSNTQEVLTALEGANFAWIESPTNPALEVADLPKIIKQAKSLGLIVGVDNTFATGLLQQPLEMGADFSMNSVTKYLSGHSDVVMGSVSSRNENLLTKVLDVRKFHGAIPGPFEAWLALRGVRTLSLRLAKAQENAMELAKRLSSHPQVDRVRYPGLETDPHHLMAKSFMKGFGAILCIEVKGGANAADRACESSKLITYATSLGGVESLWERRQRWGSEAPSIPDNLVRISVGIENIEDLWLDIDQSLRAI